MPTASIVKGLVDNLISEESKSVGNLNQKDDVLPS